MQYYQVYSLNSKGLELIESSFQAYSAGDALIRWTDKFGENYGKVVILPVFSMSYHTAFEHGTCTTSL